MEAYGRTEKCGIRVVVWGKFIRRIRGTPTETGLNGGKIFEIEQACTLFDFSEEMEQKGKWRKLWKLFKKG